MSQPDLFVVCKNCGSEVSPYVTECPYCGQRVRKRAPRIDRSAGEAEARKRRRPRLSRLRPDEIEGIAPDTRPYATFALVLAALAVTVVVQADVSLTDVGGIVLPGADDVWRWFAAPFVYDSLGYGFVALLAVGVFGSLIERRHGSLAVLLIFVLAGAAGSAVAVQLDAPALFSDAVFTPVLGANGAALGLLCAWLVDDRLAARRGDGQGNDMLGVGVFGAVLVLLSVAAEEANIAAAAGGALAGAVLGTALPLFTRRRAAY
jgi:membrane associated rhomboid family serine protease